MATKKAPASAKKAVAKKANSAQAAADAAKRSAAEAKKSAAEAKKSADDSRRSADSMGRSNAPGSGPRDELFPVDLLMNSQGIGFVSSKKKFVTLETAYVGQHAIELNLTLMKGTPGGPGTDVLNALAEFIKCHCEFQFVCKVACCDGP